jgi:protein-tyrosine-phosphatase
LNAKCYSRLCLFFSFDNFFTTPLKIQTDDFNKFERILCFDNANLKDLERMKPKGSKCEIRLLNFYNEKSKNEIIMDPWYADTLQAFESVYEDCFESCKGLLEQTQNLKK